MPKLPLPPPENGMVVRFNYQWLDSPKSTKDRPACIMLVISEPDPRVGEGEPVEEILRVVYLAISSQPPRSDQEAVEMPEDVARKLGLRPPCWVVVSECNIQFWPHDVSKIPHTDDWVYGKITPGFFNKLKTEFQKEMTRRKGAIITLNDLPARSPRPPPPRPPEPGPENTDA